jgi:uncharacterized surface protein with fasciclin (FAS1) repeats
MVSKQTGFRFALLALIVVAMLGLPIVSAAQAGNGLTSPAADATVTGKVDVKGNAGGPNFAKWQLDLLPGGNPNAAIFLALGANPGAVAYTLDTTALPDGTHALRLRNVRADGNYDEYIAKFTIANKGAAKPAAAAAAAKDIVDTAVASGKFNTLVKAVAAAGLVDALKGPGPFTVFAPTDAAFAALPPGTLDGLLKDPAALKKILLYHVLSGDVMAAQVKDGMTANTLEGAPVKFAVSNGAVKINDANIVTTDTKTSNGVIHVIDKVILPPQ